MAVKKDLGKEVDRKNYDGQRHMSQGILKASPETIDESMIYEYGWWKSEGESQFWIIYCVFEDCGWLLRGGGVSWRTCTQYRWFHHRAFV